MQSDGGVARRWSETARSAVSETPPNRLPSSPGDRERRGWGWRGCDAHQAERLQIALGEIDHLMNVAADAPRAGEIAVLRRDERRHPVLGPHLDASNLDGDVGAGGQADAVALEDHRQHEAQRERREA